MSFLRTPESGDDPLIPPPNQTDSERKMQAELLDTKDRAEKIRATDQSNTSNLSRGNPVTTTDEPVLGNNPFLDEPALAPIEEFAKYQQGSDGVVRPAGTPENYVIPQGFRAVDGMWLYPPNYNDASKLSGPYRDEERFGELPFKLHQLVCPMLSDKTGMVVSRRWSVTFQQYAYNVNWLDLPQTKFNETLQFCHFTETTLRVYQELPRYLPESVFKVGSHSTIFKNDWSEKSCSEMIVNDTIIFRGKPWRVAQNVNNDKAVWAIRCDDSIEPLVKKNGKIHGLMEAALIYYEDFDQYSNLSKWYYRRWFQLQNSFARNASYDVPNIEPKPKTLEYGVATSDRETNDDRQSEDGDSEPSLHGCNTERCMKNLLLSHARLLYANRTFLEKHEKTMMALRDSVGHLNKRLEKIENETMLSQKNDVRRNLLYSYASGPYRQIAESQKTPKVGGFVHQKVIKRANPEQIGYSSTSTACKFTKDDVFDNGLKENTSNCQ